MINAGYDEFRMFACRGDHPIPRPFLHEHHTRLRCHPLRSHLESELASSLYPSKPHEVQQENYVTTVLFFFFCYHWRAPVPRIIPCEPSPLQHPSPRYDTLLVPFSALSTSIPITAEPVNYTEPDFPLLLCFAIIDHFVRRRRKFVGTRHRTLRLAHGQWYHPKHTQCCSSYINAPYCFSNQISLL